MITREMAAVEAAGLGIETACVLAVAEVESANGGFLAPGKPAILFEALWFHNFTQGRWDATHPGISSPVWDRSLYRGGLGEWARLEEAQQLDVVAAWKSASWGTFQIMGFNYAACGFASVNDFVAAMKTDVAAHLAAFVSLVRHTPGLLPALQAKDWTTFARIYNGPGAVAQYAAKISTAYQMHARLDAAYNAAIPAPPEALPAPVITGPPLPEHDAYTPPPTGYVENAAGNVVRENVDDSTIVKAGKAGQIVTGGAAAVTAAAGAASQVKGVLTGISDVGVICVTVVVLVCLGMAFWYFRRTVADRRDLNRKGIA